MMSKSSTSSSSPFVTTSDVLNRINSHLAEQFDQGGSTDNNNEKSSKSFFELHKKLPDGSSRKATEDEQASADFQNKLEQAAAFVQTLQDDKEKIKWAEKQRENGNKLYHIKEYKQALDIYMTSLVVVGENNDNNNNNNRKNCHEKIRLFAKTMNNMSICTIQLCWYKKTIQFCTMGIEHIIEKISLLEAGDDIITLELSKLYYKRAKASRLRGEYNSAKDDLKQSRTYIESIIHNNTTVDYIKSIEKEQQLLEKAVAEAIRNKDKQKKSMQKLFSNDISNQSFSTIIETSPLYDDNSGNKGQQNSNIRTYSTLRAPPSSSSSSSEDYIDDDFIETRTYWQMYLHIIGKQAQRLLDYLDEREKILQQQQQQQQQQRYKKED